MEATTVPGVILRPKGATSNQYMMRCASGASHGNKYLSPITLAGAVGA